MACHLLRSFKPLAILCFIVISTLANKQWDQFAGFLYKFFDGPANFWQAEQECNKLGARLASIHSDEEGRFVYGIAPKYGKYSHDDIAKSWIGLSKSNNPGSQWSWNNNPSSQWTWNNNQGSQWTWNSNQGSQWRWTDGTNVDYFNWRPGMPDNAFFGEHCVHIYTHPNFFPSNWNDQNCDQMLDYYVCKKPVGYGGYGGCCNTYTMTLQWGNCCNIQFFNFSGNTIQKSNAAPSF